MAKRKTSTLGPTPKAEPKAEPKAIPSVSLSRSVVEEVHKLLPGAKMTKADVERVLYVIAANDARLAAITTVLELTPAIVKNLYEINADTNAFNDAAVTKLAGIENGAQADQTDIEIAIAYGNQVGAASQVEAEAGTLAALRTWSPLRIAQAISALGGGGGGGAYGKFDLSSGVVTAKGEYSGVDAPVLTNPSSGTYVLTVPAGTVVASFSLFGNNTTLNGSNEFLLQLDNSANGIQRSYVVAQYIATTGGAADKFSIGTNETESFPFANVTQLLFPGMNGYGSGGFRLVLA